MDDYSGTFNITDYRWFNLRDSTSGGLTTLAGPSFSSDGLLYDDYSAKPSFGPTGAWSRRSGGTRPPRPPPGTPTGPVAASTLGAAVAAEDSSPGADAPIDGVSMVDVFHHRAPMTGRHFDPVQRWRASRPVR